MEIPFGIFTDATNGFDLDPSRPISRPFARKGRVHIKRITITPEAAGSSPSNVRLVGEHRDMRYAECWKLLNKAMVRFRRTKLTLDKTAGRRMAGGDGDARRSLSGPEAGR